MTSERFRFNDIIPFEVLFTNDKHEPMADAIGEITIRRKSDNLYWTGSNWDVVRVSIPMIEVDITQAPGWWKYDFDSSLGEEVDQYVIEIKDMSGNAANTPEPLFTYVGGYLNSIEVMLTRSLGLMFENSVLEPIKFKDDIMIEAELRLYDSKDNAILDDKQTGLIVTYKIDSPHCGNRLDRFTQTLETVS